MDDREAKRERKLLAQSEVERRTSALTPKRFPWLPKFWRDTGGWNDTVVSMFSALSPLVTMFVCAFYFDRPLLGFLLIPVGWVVGMILGFLTIATLCTLFGYTDTREG